MVRISLGKTILTTNKFKDPKLKFTINQTLEFKRTKEEVIDVCIIGTEKNPTIYGETYTNIKDEI